MKLYKALSINLLLIGLTLSGCDKQIPKHVHSWGEVIYSWSDDNSSCTAKRVCLTNEKHIEEETKSSTLVVDQSPTCENSGQGHYEVTFDNPAFEAQSKDTVLNATGHKYENPTYSWSSDYSSCTAQVVCANDSSHIITETKDSTYSVTKVATPEEDGVGTYKVEFDNIEFTTQTHEIVIDYYAPWKVNKDTFNNIVSLKNQIDNVLDLNYTCDIYIIVNYRDGYWICDRDLTAMFNNGMIYVYETQKTTYYNGKVERQLNEDYYLFEDDYYSKSTNKYKMDNFSRVDYNADGSWTRWTSWPREEDYSDYSGIFLASDYLWSSVQALTYSELSFDKATQKYLCKDKDVSFNTYGYDKLYEYSNISIGFKDNLLELFTFLLKDDDTTYDVKISNFRNRDTTSFDLPDIPNS